MVSLAVLKVERVSLSRNHGCEETQCLCIIVVSSEQPEKR